MLIASTPNRTRLATWLAVFALIVIPAIVYFRVAHFDFIKWDDDKMLYENPHVQALSAENLRWMFTDATYNRLYMPLGWLGYALSIALVGLSANAQHLINLCLHIANALLVFAILREILEARAAQARPSSAAPTAIIISAFVGALFWAVHPLRVEVVAWVGARVHSISAISLLAAFWCYLHAVRNQSSPWRRPTFWASILLYAASLVTFPSGIMFPFILPILDTYILNRPRRGNPWRNFIGFTLEKLPFYFIVGTPLLVSLWGRFHNRLFHPLPQTSNFPIFTRILQACYVYIHYIWVTLVPIHLAPVYLRLKNISVTDPDMFASLSLVMAISIIAFFLRKKLPVLWAAWLCHLIFILPFLGLTERPHSTADRYTYLESLIWSGFLATAALYALAASPANMLQKLTIPLLSLALLGGCILSYQQTAMWSDSVTFFTTLIDSIRQPEDVAGLNARLAAFYLENNQLDNALEYATRALRATPNDMIALRVQANTYTMMAETLANKLPSEQINQLYRNAAAASDLLSQNEPTANSYAVAGYAYNYLHHLAEAEDRMSHAVQLAPDNPQMRLGLAKVLAYENKMDRATQELDQAAALSPEIAAQRDVLLDNWRIHALSAPTTTAP